MFGTIRWVFDMGGILLKTFLPKQYTFFIFYWIWWRLAFCLVFVLRICEFTLYWSLLLTTGQRNGSIYCNWKCITFSFLSRFLHKPVHVHPIIIFFCILNIFTLCEELSPQNMNLGHNGMNIVSCDIYGLVDLIA